MLLESNDSLSGSAKSISVGLTWGFTFLKNGLGKSNGSPKREVVFAFGNSSIGGITKTMGTIMSLLEWYIPFLEDVEVLNVGSPGSTNSRRH